MLVYRYDDILSRRTVVSNDSKSSCLHGHVGSNPTFSATGFKPNKKSCLRTALFVAISTKAWIWNYSFSVLFLFSADMVTTFNSGSGYNKSVRSCTSVNF